MKHTPKEALLMRKRKRSYLMKNRNTPFRKIIGLIVILFLCFVSSILAQETITLTTYYPSPFGVYDRLRLAPRAALPAADCNGTSIGLMYYDDALNSLRVCEDIGAGPQWGSVGGSGIWRRDAGLEYVYLQNINDFVGIGLETPQEIFHIRAIGDTKAFIESETSHAALRIKND